MIKDWLVPIQRDTMWMFLQGWFTVSVLAAAILAASEHWTHTLAGAVLALLAALLWVNAADLFWAIRSKK